MEVSAAPWWGQQKNTKSEAIFFLRHSCKFLCSAKTRKVRFKPTEGSDCVFFAGWRWWPQVDENNASPQRWFPQSDGSGGEGKKKEKKSEERGLGGWGPPIGPAVHKMAIPCLYNNILFEVSCLCFPLLCWKYFLFHLFIYSFLINIIFIFILSLHLIDAVML